ncbi:MAG TPA: Ig-like domain-containing protein [Gammaproteobacteria bacterium]
MNRKTGWLGILLLLALASCGGEGEGLAGFRNGPPQETPEEELPPTLQSMEVLASAPQLQSDGSTTVTLTALPKNVNNQVVPGIDVLFSANSGTLVVTEAVTNEQGVATAELNTGGDPSNRTITVTASTVTTGTTTATEVLSDSVDIEVVGSTLQIQGPASLANGDVGTYILRLADSAGNGIAGKTVTLTSENGNTLSAATLTTDANGDAEVELQAVVTGSDTLTASALPDTSGAPTVTVSTGISVSGDIFTFTAPSANKEIVLGAVENVTIAWEKNGDPQDGASINLATTRGTLSSPTVTLGADGTQTFQISSSTAGPAVITAINADGTSTQTNVEFVATVPDTISLQPTLGVVAPEQSSTIIATVLDPNNNPVKDAIVNFTVADVTGGSLSTASAITDSQGRAQTVYTASTLTSADDGVTVTGRVANTALQADTTLTVSGDALFINFGTGNTIVEDANDTRYILNYVVMVTDASGAGVPNQTVTISALPDMYRLGYLVEDALTGDVAPKVEAFCANEDLNLNGVLDAGEDQNLARYPEQIQGDANNNGSTLDEDLGFGVLEPGNRALVSPGTVTTDETGLAEFQLIYPQSFALWMDVILTAKASVAGTESQYSQLTGLPMTANDVQSPPNGVSPFGTDYFFQNNCSNEDTNTTLY